MSDDNSSSTIELNRRRVLGGLGTIGVASAGAGAGTFALFSDTEESTNNSVQAGTLDLSTGSAETFTANATNIAPGEATGAFQVDLTNSGSLVADHVEIGVSYTENDSGEPSDDGLDNDVSADALAERLFATDFQFPNGTDIGFGNVFGTFLSDSQGAAVIDTDGSGGSDVVLERTNQAGREDVVKADSDGTSTTDYAISMRSVSSTGINGVASGTITFDYYAGSTNENAAPDEVYVLVNDSNSDNRLFYRTANDGSPQAQSWKTRDVGAEIAGDAANSLDDGRSWKEAAPNQNTYSAPDNGGLANDIDGTIEAVGFGRGFLTSAKQLETYYDNLVVGGSSYKFRPVSLYDLSNRGVFDSLSGLTANGGSGTFEARFKFDRLAGNAFQGDGVDIDFTFGLAQNSGQSVI